MAPATIAGAVPRSRTGREARWDRDSIISAIHEWVATYGEPPRAADWNPSTAKWAGQLWRVERYRAGRADGSPWPALNTAKRPFGGSLTAAIRAAGHEPARPGPRRRADVDPAQAHRAVISPEGRAMLAAAAAQTRAAERRVEVLEAKLERASTTRTRVARDDAAVARAQRRVAAAEAKAVATAGSAREQVAEARMDTAEARTAAKRMAAKLERAEATIATLRGERREQQAPAPAGPAVMAAALRDLAAARRSNNPERMQDALRRVAQAAAGWKERI